MKESEYITASNLTRLRVIDHLLREMIPNKNLTGEQIRSFATWTQRMMDKHFALVEEK